MSAPYKFIRPEEETHHVEDPSNGEKRWYKGKLLHREDGPAVECVDGSTMWYFEGRLHRIGGPAYEFVNYHKHWWVDGKLHREDGPAVEHADGNVAWWLDGIHYLSYETYQEAVKLRIVKQTLES